MNYLNHFGLLEVPYDKKSSDAFYFQSKSAKEAAARLSIIEQHGGNFHLYGGYGTGKTSLLNHLYRNSLSDNETVYIDFVTLKSYGILYQIAQGLSIDPAFRKIKLYGQIMEKLRCAKKRPAIIIDDACKLSDDSLEDIRLLTSCDFDQQAPFSLILSSGPALTSVLSQHPALKQRISLFYHLLPFDKTETKEYLYKRFVAAGGKTYPFNEEAQSAIFDFSGGIARLINKMASLTLITAAARQTNFIDAQICRCVINELNQY